MILSWLIYVGQVLKSIQVSSCRVPEANYQNCEDANAGQDSAHHSLSPVELWIKQQNLCVRGW